MNTRLLAALVAVSSLTAFAQHVAIDVDDGDGNTAQVQVPGVSVQMRVNTGNEAPPPPNQAARPRVPRPPPVAVVGMDSFDVGFELKPQETLRLLGPDGARADIWGDDGGYVGGFNVPCEVRARPGQYYRVVMTLNGGLVLDRKFELRQYYRTNVFFRGAQVAPVVIVAQPMLQMVDFPALVEAVKAETFGDAQLDVVRTAEGGLTVDQLGQLVDLFTFSGEKVKVVEICAQRLVDRQNAFKLYKHFDFDSDKQKVKALLGK